MKPRERLLKTLTLTVLASILIFFVVTFLVVGFTDGFSDKIIDPKMIENDFSDKIEPNNSSVPVAEIAADLSIDTETGWMIVNYDIPDVLPLCITEEYLDSNFAITVATYGGYSPDGWGILAIDQPKTGITGGVGINWVYAGSFVCTDTTLDCYGCLVDVYVADFVLPEPILLDSNHLPNVAVLGADWATMVDDPTCTLNKWVNLAILSTWKGCEDPDQKFQLILAQ